VEMTMTRRGMLLPAQSTFSILSGARLSNTTTSTIQVPRSIRIRVAIWGNTWWAPVCGTFSIKQRAISNKEGESASFHREADFFARIRSGLNLGDASRACLLRCSPVMLSEAKHLGFFAWDCQKILIRDSSPATAGSE